MRHNKLADANVGPKAMTRGSVALAAVLLVNCRPVAQSPASSQTPISSVSPTQQAAASSCPSSAPNPSPTPLEAVETPGPVTGSIASGHWETFTPMSVPRVFFTATFMAILEILIAGGGTDKTSAGLGVSGVEVYDPYANRDLPIYSLAMRHSGHIT